MLLPSSPQVHAIFFLSGESVQPCLASSTSVDLGIHACMHACTTYALSGITHFFCTRKKRKKKQWWMDLDFTKLTPRSTCEAYSHDFRVGKCSKNQNPRWTGTSSTPIYSHTIFGCEYYCMLLPWYWDATGGRLLGCCRREGMYDVRICCLLVCLFGCLVVVVFVLFCLSRHLPARVLYTPLGQMIDPHFMILI